jgi:hypothetical protein
MHTPCPQYQQLPGFVECCDITTIRVHQRQRALQSVAKEISHTSRACWLSLAIERLRPRRRCHWRHSIFLAVWVIPALVAITACAPPVPAETQVVALFRIKSTIAQWSLETTSYSSVCVWPSTDLLS